jgi:hypothetical protein
MTSAVKRQAPQLSRKAALTSPLRRPGPRVAEVPIGPAQSNWGKQNNMPASGMVKRTQYVAPLRARTRNSRSIMGRKVMR